MAASATARRRRVEKTAKDVGYLGTFEELDVDILNVDHTYQRDLDMMRVQRYAAEWSVYACGTLTVSRRRDGVCYVVNGQHRWAAAKMAGERTVKCYVVEGLTSQEEAKLRLATNDMKTDRPAERFRAQIAAGDPRSVAIDEIVRNAGTEINVGTASMASGINAIASLEFVFDRDQGLLLTRTLELLKDSFGGKLNGETAGAAFLKGIAFLLERHPAPELDRSHLVQRLNITGPAQIKRRAIDYRAVHGGAGWLNVYRAATEIYNEKLSQGRKLQWRTHGWSAGSSDRGSGI